MFHTIKPLNYSLNTFTNGRRGWGFIESDETMPATLTTQTRG